MSKAISIKQPWASLICSGIKDIENRTWPTRYRGRIFIHASKVIDTRFLNNPVDKIFTDAQNKAIPFNEVGELYIPGLAFSAIIGEAVITDCIQDSKSIWAEPGAWHWLIKKAVLYDRPVKCNGALSFWQPPIFEAQSAGLVYKSYVTI